MKITENYIAVEEPPVLRAKWSLANKNDRVNRPPGKNVLRERALNNISKYRRTSRQPPIKSNLFTVKEIYL